MKNYAAPSVISVFYFMLLISVYLAHKGKRKVQQPQASSQPPHLQQQQNFDHLDFNGHDNAASASPVAASTSVSAVK